MTSTPETPESKPKGGFMGMLDKVKSAVSNAVPSNISMEDIKNKVKEVKAQAESASASMAENIKKVDIDKISNKIKDTVNSVKEKASGDSDKNKEDKS